MGGSIPIPATGAPSHQLGCSFIRDSYREHFTAIAAIQLIIKALLNSHMYSDSKMFSCMSCFVGVF